jgi:hypothetical protein
MSETVEKSARGASPILLVLAALCFLLPFVGVSCNTAAGGAALGSALSQAGGLGSSGNAAAAQSCLQALNGRDLATYSGVDPLTGGNPTTPTNIPGCGGSSTPSASPQAGIGVQPLIVVAFILMLVGILATLLRAPLRPLVAGGATLIAALLIILNNASVHTPILNKLTSSSGTSLSSLGLSGGVDAFFNVHAALGFTLVMVGLLLALAVNVVALMLGSSLRLTTAAVPPPPPAAGTTPTAGFPPPPEEDTPPS